MQTWHKIKLDVYRVSYRACRPYQEKIDDFYDNGKIRFQWDMIRQAYLMAGEQTLPAICAQCPLNLRLDCEGCQIEIDGLSAFLNLTVKYMPESVLLNYRLQYDFLDIDIVRQLYKEMLEFEKMLADIKWPVARVLNGDSPVMIPDGTGGGNPLYYPWEGEEEETFPFGSDSYYWGMNKDGIVVKDSFGNKAPYSFKKLYKQGFGVYGISDTGKMHTFVPVLGKFPSWSDPSGFTGSELVADEEKASLVFAKQLNTIIVFAEEAMKNNTGLLFEQIV